MKYYVYELVNPLTGLVFYVGKGTGIRAEKHFKYPKKDSTLMKDRIIRKIIAEGQEPLVQKVFFTDDETEAYAFEIGLIEKYGRKADGSGILSNICVGGGGGDTVTGSDPERVRSRYEKRRKTIAENPEITEKLKKVGKQVSTLVWSDERRSDQIAAITRGIRENRDKAAHAKAVSDGYKNQTPEKRETSRNNRRAAAIKRGAGQNENFRKAVVQPSIIIKPDGSEIKIDSLMKWCQDNNHSYGILEAIRRGIHPKTSQSKYYGWKVIKQNKDGNI